MLPIRRDPTHQPSDVADVRRYPIVPHQRYSVLNLTRCLAAELDVCSTEWLFFGGVIFVYAVSREANTRANIAETFTWVSAGT